MKQQYISLLTIAILSISSDIYGQITGKAWRDHNANGQVETTETGQPKLAVRAYDAQGKIVTTTVTDAEGYYHLNVPRGKRVRVEFNGIPEGYFPVAGHTRTHFVTSPGEALLGIYAPLHYLGANPLAVQAVYSRGSLSNKDVQDKPSLVVYSALPGDSTRETTPLATVGRTGSLWGLAFERNSGNLYLSALAKRHSALGPLGAGGIYVTSVKNPEIKDLLNLDALGYATLPTPLVRNLTEDLEKPDHDSLMFGQVGKIGLGGLDVSDDGSQLWTMNLHDRHLYRIELINEKENVTPGAITRFPIPFMSYNGGTARPFAVKYYNGQVYIGVVNDAQTSQNSKDLRAYIYSVGANEKDASKAKFKEVTSFSLLYPRGELDYGVKGWFPWTDNDAKAMLKSQPGWMIYPQPILADMEFDTDGSIIVSLMDRLGHQAGDGQLIRTLPGGPFSTYRGLAGGDLIRLNATRKKFTTEENGTAGARLSIGQDNGEGPGGGEFYYDDAFTEAGITWHHETAAGGLALLPEENKVLVSFREPDSYLSGGVRWFDNDNGKAVKGFSVFPGGNAGYFYKLNNVGDIDLITQAPDTEVGDRIWLDNNGDGLQGADEPVLGGVVLELYRAGKKLAETISDEAGNYHFNNQNVSEGLQPSTSYEVRIALQQASKKLTLSNTHCGELELNSDANEKEGYAVISFTTTLAGENIHNLDFGFKCNDKPFVAAKMDCKDGQARITLTGQTPAQRYDLTPTENYEGGAQYATALPLDKTGLINAGTISGDESYQATVRVYSESGCYSDVYVSSIGQPGCEAIPGNITLEEAYSMVIYPNPTTGSSKLNYRGGKAQSSIRINITDIQGRVLESSAGTLSQGYYSGTIDLIGKVPGTYQVIILEDEHRTSRSILKN